MKRKTNKQRLKSLFKELENTPYEVGLAVLRERLLLIAELTKKDIQDSPDEWNANPFFSAAKYSDLCDKIVNHLAFED